MDAIIVYGQMKSTFGWPDNPTERPVPSKSAPHSSQGEEEEEDGVDILPVVSDKPVSHLGR